MSQQIQCPHCGQAYVLTDEQVPQYAGQTITCTRCQKPFTVAQNLAAQTVDASAAPSPASQAAPTGAAPTFPFPPTRVAPMGYAQGGYGTPQQSNGLAVAALVLAIIGILFFPAALLGIVLGIIALVKTKDPQVGGKGMAIGAITVGGVSLLLAGCFLAIFIPMIGKAHSASDRVRCAANLREIGTAIQLYANDNAGAYPPKIELLLPNEDIEADVFNCPATSATPAPGATPQQQAAALTTPGHLSYVYVGGNLTNSASVSTVVAYEPLTNHNDGANFLWGDGHVSWETKTRAQQLISTFNAARPSTAPAGGH